MLSGVVVAFVALRVTIGDWVGAFLSLAILVLASTLLFAVVGYLWSNIPDWSRRLRGVSREDHLKSLEENGKAFREHYQTYRVVTFEDLRTSCLVHLIDMGDSKLLCLYGQRYYDFEPIEDHPEVNQCRKFPTKTFSLLRRRSDGEVLALFPGAEVVEPAVCEAIAAVPKAIEGLGLQFRDGEFVSGISFDEVEATCRALGTRVRTA
jgi:hypothetical protein